MAESETMKHRVFAAQLDLLRRKHDSVLAGVLGASGLLVVLLWSSVERGPLLAWFGAQVALSAVRYLFMRAYDRAPADRRTLRYWARGFTLGSALSGMLWGSLSLLLLNAGQLENVALITVAVIGMSAVALGALSVHPPSQNAFAITSVGLLALTLAFNGYPDLAALAVPYLIANVVFSRLLSGSVRRSLELRFENQELLEALREQHQLAEKANRDKSDLLAAVSHDLRQPVHAMGFFVDALETHGLAPDAAKMVARIKRSLLTLDGLFHSLLEMSRLEAGMIDPQRRPIRVEPILAGLVEEFTPLARRRELRLAYVPTRIAVDSDPVLLERMVRNLISNAVRYTASGGVVVGVRQRRGERIAIEVRDTGPGMNEEQCRASFQAFRRLEHTQEAIDFGEGLGLGLAIVGHLSRLLDHPLEIDSVPGRGSAFRLLAPRAVVPLELAPKRLSGEMEFTDREILVLDDDPDVCDALQAALERWGCRVRLASTPDEALAIAAPPPEIIIADYRLPGNAKGTETLRALERLIGHPVPALLITGDTSPERLSEARSAGYPLLRKPVTPAHLRTALHRLIRGEALGQPLA